jgi:hypothetical protein
LLELPVHAADPADVMGDNGHWYPPRAIVWPSALRDRGHVA